MATDYTAQINAAQQAVSYTNATAGDLAVYNAELNSGTTMAQVDQQIVNSPFVTKNVDPVIALYQAAFGRVPDAAGLKAEVQAVEAGLPLAPTSATSTNSLVSSFANSPEFMAKYGVTAISPSSQALVYLLYQNVLGRAPDAAGLAYWTAQPLNAQQLLAAFALPSLDPEYSARIAANVKSYEYDETGGAGSNPVPTTGTLFQVPVSGGQGGTGSTFTISPGAGNGGGVISNTFNGTAGNDTFNAPAGTLGGLGGAVPVIINGGGGVDTLNAVVSGGTFAPDVSGVANINLSNSSSGGLGAYNFVNTTGATTLGISGSGFVGALNLNPAQIKETDVAAGFANAGATAATLQLDFAPGTLAAANKAAELVKLGGGDNVALELTDAKGFAATGLNYNQLAKGDALALTLDSEGTTANTVVLSTAATGPVTAGGGSVTTTVTGVEALTLKLLAADANNIVLTGSGFSSTLTLGIDLNGTTPADINVGTVTGFTAPVYQLTDSTNTANTATDTVFLFGAQSGSTVQVGTSLAALSVGGATGNTGYTVSLNSTSATPTPITVNTLTDTDAVFTINSTNAGSGNTNTIKDLTDTALTSLSVTGDSAISIALDATTGNSGGGHSFTINAAAATGAVTIDTSLVNNTNKAFTLVGSSTGANVLADNGTVVNESAVTFTGGANNTFDIHAGHGTVNASLDVITNLKATDTVVIGQATDTVATGFAHTVTVTDVNKVGGITQAQQAAIDGAGSVQAAAATAGLTAASTATLFQYHGVEYVAVTSAGNAVDAIVQVQGIANSTPAGFGHFYDYH